MTVTEESVRRDPRIPIERVTCRVYLSTNQVDLTDTVWTKILVNTKSYDLGENFDNVTNYRFDVPVSGLYAIWGKVDFVNVAANKHYGVALYVNGSAVMHRYAHVSGTAQEVDANAYDEQFLKKGDYVELYAQSNAGVNTVDIEAGASHTLLGVRLITREGIR